MKYKLMSILLFSLSLASLFAADKTQVLSDGGTLKLAKNKPVAGSPAWVNDPVAEKLDPVLRHLIRQDSQRLLSKRPAAETFASFSSGFALDMHAQDQVFTSVFIRSDNTDATTSAVRAAGGAVSTVAGDILVAQLPLDMIMPVASNSNVSSMQICSRSEALLNVSRVSTKVDQVHTGNGLSQVYKGAGVVLGVVDSGIDWSHDDFYTGTGESRIVYLWDMSGSGNPPAGYDYGTEYTKANIEAQQVSEVDGDDGGGHGTHVAGTAAGSGRANAAYIGMAPESDIIFVKGFRSGPGFADNDVVDGCNYIFTKATQMGKPAVINLSLGGHFGAHDGSSLYEQALSNLTGPGKIIVAAAGNEGADQNHLSYTASGSSIDEAWQTIWILDGSSTSSLVDMWYDSGDIAVGVAVYDAQLNLLVYTNPVVPGQSIENVEMNDGFTTHGLVSIDATTLADPNNGARRVAFLIDSDNGQYPVQNVYWTIYTYGNGTFDAWVVFGGFFTGDDQPSLGLKPGDSNGSVGMPATAQNVIAVGSYVTKTSWIDLNGVTQQQPGSPVLGARSSFSSVGPSRDGRNKPDLVAPGEAILSALSSHLTVGPNGLPEENILQGGLLQKQQGTSMASPHVSGVVALMLQRNPSLTYTQIFNTLTTTTIKDAFTGTTPNSQYGYGKLDALNAVQSTISTDINDVTPEIPQVFSLEQNYPNPFNPLTVIRYNLPQSGPVDLAIFDVTGRKVATLISGPQNAGTHDVTWNASRSASGIYYYKLTSDNFQNVKKMMLLR